ncbi:MAG: MurR/RpiR family transcriptional regulator [Ruminococcaceae bacterium]|nr:MurR/RpiR family transcriptional regulator [Oscillospiraceae bacterium]
MNRTLLLAKSHYGEMGKSEKKIADWLFSHSGEAFPYSITELAEKCDSSEATIVRFSKRLGFNGYQDLKIALAQELEKKIITPYITAEDSCFEMLEKLCNDIYLSLERTKKNIGSANMTEASEVIAKARKVILIGLGSSSTVAAEASNKFLRAGCNAYSYSDTHMQAIAVSQLSYGDVLIGISQSGSSKDIVECLRLAKTRGATTICVTAKERSPITKQSDIVLITDTEELRHSDLGLSSHLSRTVVMDALCYRIAYMNEEKTIEGMNQGEISLVSKRITE